MPNLLTTVEKMPDELEVRRWAFELENPAVANVYQELGYQARMAFDFTNDGSVDTIECECECDDCLPHSCDCSHCDRADYYDPEHCSTCTANEICNARPMTTALTPETREMLKELAEVEWTTEDAPNWSGHLHVEARDLDKSQARAVVIGFIALCRIAPEWFTGWRDRYNSENDRANLDRWVQGDRWAMDDRTQWVNVRNLPHEVMPYNVGDGFDHRKTTIEFRRFRYTSDALTIKARGAVCRALIAYAKSNQPLYWLTSAKDFEKMAEVLEVGKH